MQSRRDYAASLGLAIAGARGKFSNDAKAAIATAEAGGMRFSDTVTPKTKPVDPTGPVEYTKADTKEVGDYRSASEYRFPEQSYKAVTDDGKEIGMREGCNNCGYSLLDHRCEMPSALGQAVSIVAR